MARPKKALRILYPEEQRYACRDCPARCCRTPWGIPVSPEVAHVILQDEELRTRLVGRAPGVLASGILPMIEKEGQLQCVLLEDDLLCGLQKRHGHQSLPQACQAYPFGFMKNEQGQEVALLSRHCPSIRDNTGEPLRDQIEQKLVQAGGSRSLTTRMGLPSGRTLSELQYVAVVRAWQQQLQAGSPLLGVLRAYSLTESFDQALPQSPRLENREIQAALDQAQGTLDSVRLEPRKKPTFQARLFYAHELGNLSYPSRVMTDFSVRRPTWGQRLGSWSSKLAWLFELGSVDLLYVPGRVPLGKIRRIPPFLEGEWGGLVRDYLVEVLERRQVFVKQTYLTRTAVDLGLMVALISRFARASAAGQKRSEVNRADVLEGLGVADLLMAHQADAVQSTVLAQLRLQLMSDTAAFSRFLASEA